MIIKSNKAVAIIFSLLLLSGCSNNFSDYLKESANSKLIVGKGYESSKLKSIYHRKHRSLPKKNVIEENYHDEENLNCDNQQQRELLVKNRQIYLDMIKRDAKRKKSHRFETYSYPYIADNEDDTYPSLIQAKQKIQQMSNDQQLQEDLEQIKAMLNKAKKDLAKYKCPMQQSNQDIQPHNPKDILLTIPSQESKSVRPKKSKLKEEFITTGDNYKKIRNNEVEEEQ